MERETVVRDYYAALDEHGYERLRELLAPSFVQRRPDRTFEGRETFVEFMRAGRPLTDTTHALDAVYARTRGDADRIGSGHTETADAPVAERARGDPSEAEFAVRGRLLDADGEERFCFVDIHRLEGECIVELRTYTQ